MPNQNVKPYPLEDLAFEICQELQAGQTLHAPASYKVLTSPIFNESKETFFKVAYDPVTGHTADLD